LIGTAPRVAALGAEAASGVRTPADWQVSEEDQPRHLLGRLARLYAHVTVGPAGWRCGAPIGTPAIARDGHTPPPPVPVPPIRPDDHRVPGARDELSGHFRSERITGHDENSGPLLPPRPESSRLPAGLAGRADPVCDIPSVHRTLQAHETAAPRADPNH